MSWRVENNFHFMEMIMASTWRMDLKGQDSDHPVERQWWSRAPSPRMDPERQLQLMFRKQSQYSLMVEHGEDGVKVLAGATRRMGCCLPSQGSGTRSRFWGDEDSDKFRSWHAEFGRKTRRTRHQVIQGIVRKC